VLVLKGINGSPYDLEGAFTNSGNIKMLSGNLRLRDGQLYNQLTGLVDFQSDSGLSSYGVGTELLLNKGVLRKSNGTGTSSIDVPLTNLGLVDAQVGSVSLDSTCDLTGGRLNCGINSLGSYGLVHFSHSVAMAGAFTASLNNGYLPGVGATFNVVSYPSRLSTFSSVALPLGYTWETNYTSTVFTLKVMGTVVVPGFQVNIEQVNRLPHLSWNSIPGDKFQAQYMDHLVDGAWLNLGPILTATSTTTDITDSTANTISNRFYRAVQLP
jgi:hypothetical protein